MPGYIARHTNFNFFLGQQNIGVGNPLVNRVVTRSSTNGVTGKRVSNTFTVLVFNDRACAKRYRCARRHEGVP